MTLGDLPKSPTLHDSIILFFRLRSSEDDDENEYEGVGYSTTRHKKHKKGTANGREQMPIQSEPQMNADRLIAKNIKRPRGQPNS